MRLWLTCFLLCLSCIIACNKDDINAPAGPLDEIPALSQLPGDVAVKWANTILYNVRYSAFNTPTYTSRTLAYMGLAMYESVVRGDSSYSSMSGELEGLSLPQPEMGKKYHWIICLNAAEQTLIKHLYPIPGNGNQYVYDTIDVVADSILKVYSKGLTEETINRSAQFGRNIADAIYNWSKSDGGDGGWNKNFDPSFVFPTGDSYWVPPTRGQSTSRYPLHPYWGQNRTFAKANSSLSIPPIVPFSTDPTSEYYKLYKAVYDKDKVLTLPEMEIAAWWGDDPTESASPPGHSYYLAGLAVKKSKANLMKAAETFAKTGMAVADAFINCWKVKYVYFNERPSSYVVKYIDPTFRQFWPEPPFPAFSSGHSTQASAVATVLAGIYGDVFAFTDDLHEGKRRFDDMRFMDLRYPARSFNSFSEFANECAYSRFLGGIHTQQDNEIGMIQGAIVGQNVNALKWKK